MQRRWKFYSIAAALLILCLIVEISAATKKPVPSKKDVVTKKVTVTKKDVITKKSAIIKKAKAAKKTATIKPADAVTKKKSVAKQAKAVTVKKAAQSAVFDETTSADADTGSSCYDSCYPNSTFLSDAGKIRNPEKQGTFLEACGRTYLFGKEKVTWEQNWKRCCALGMMPVLIESSEESECLLKKIPTNLTENRAFWTGGFKHELNNMWSWCTKDSPEPIDESLITEVSSDKSKLDDNCIQMAFDYSILLSNDKCDARFTLACESFTKSVVDLVGTNKCKAQCINKECIRNTTLFKKAGLDERFELTDRYKHGRWVSKCGRYFLFSGKQATYYEARDMCCALGTRLVALKTEAKRKCLTKLSKDYPDTVGSYWTSGADIKCPDNYRWCSVDRAFLRKEINWAPGQPNNKTGDCVYMTTNALNPKNTTLSTSSCTTKRQFACEVRQSGTTVEAVQKECVELISLTNNEVYSLDYPDNYTYRMKCYVKCLGDNLGMLVNGTLQEGNVLRLMESSNEKSDMQKGYDAVERCKNKGVKNDECESAYRMYMCGKREAPVVFGKVVVYKFRIEGYVYPPVEIKIPRICDLKQNVDCRENRSAKFEFTNTGKVNGAGSAINGWDGKKWYKSEFGVNHTYEYAYKSCCMLEMQLPTAKTFDDFKKLYDFMNGTKVDNYYGETYSNEIGERWCHNDVSLDPELSNDNFRVAHERSFLYTRRGGKPLYKLTTLMYSHMYDTKVNYFFCEPMVAEL